MPSDRTVVREIDWSSVFPWISLFATLRLAVNFRALILAAVGLVAMSAGWKLCGVPFGLKFDAQPWPWTGASISLNQQVLADAAQLTPRQAMLSSSSAQTAAPLQQFGWWLSSPLLQAWQVLSAPAHQLFDAGASFKRFTYLLLCLLWACAVWGFFGAAISRLAAVRLARHQQLTWSQAIGFAVRKWPAFFAAPLFPLLGVALLSIPLALIGLLLWSGVTSVLAGLLWIVVVAIGVVLSILLFGLFFGWPLMYATISTEGTDSFDALSRSYAYTYQRPLHYLFYVAVACLIGILGFVFVQFFAQMVIQLGFWGVSWGSSSERLGKVVFIDFQSPGGSSHVGSTLIWFWLSCVEVLKVAFLYSYFWTAMAGVYFLLRRNVDATEMDEVFLTDDEESFGLPPLTTDAAGVTKVADAGPAATGAGDDRTANDG